MMKYQVGNIFAVHHGDYAGQMFALVEKEELSYNFLRMPDMKNVSVTKNDFEEGIDKEIIKYVEDLPDDIFDTIEQQYNKNENTNN